MLPSNPLLDIIATDFGKPLIATSANISGSPIIHKDEPALSNLFQIADMIVSHDREIIVPEDDSVVLTTRYTGAEIILRRSRGLAPSFLQYKPITREVIVATGALLKSSFTIAVNGNIFISQFLGSTESFESEEVYKETLSHWLKLYDAVPKIIVTDNHPNYFSNQYGVELSKKYNADIKIVQHHEAHFAAVLAENDLIESPQPVLGIIWDGTGLGHDGNIWGGEFFVYDQKIISRCCHFDYFPVIAGDKLAMEPRIALLCTTYNEWPKLPCIREKFNHTEWKNYQSLIRTATLFSSSAGRIFDAVASLLNVCDKQTYEGEAAMYLQALAEDWVDKNKFEMDDSYFAEAESYERIPTSSLLHNVIRDVKSGLPKNYIAAKFHYSLVHLVGLVAKKMNVKKICFSGGVFQNALLVDWIRDMYTNEYELFFHIQLSPNDENISFGQLAYYDNDVKSVEFGRLSQEPSALSREPGAENRDFIAGNYVRG
jgi:hydrogenase maturation protein HypF